MPSNPPWFRKDEAETKPILWMDELDTVPLQGEPYYHRHLPMPRHLALDLFQHEFQHGRYAAHYAAISAPKVVEPLPFMVRCPQAMVIDAILAGG